ncbi:hypothetical protein BDZ90DRAFT_280226 [Jaminaea rosea]|uniref:Uncharacterized protein n=1 Tax=Jaminaea rosea TaxID=1569628 RepID=A0A316UP47_9BASI|nr:hypothetical protein BDZ90DRAFT_280226 [Jaminaea rosea]PWN26734.1 hypothetical protein BDZ90DRAFT_280226 [Jaminaea rosea]
MANSAATTTSSPAAGAVEAKSTTRTMAPLPERRAGSSRVRRLPKHLRSPSPPPACFTAPSTTATSAAAQVQPASSTSSSHVATSANTTATAKTAGGTSKKRQTSVTLLDPNETSGESRRRSRPSGGSKPKQTAAAAAPQTQTTSKAKVRLAVKPIADQSTGGYESDGGRAAPAPTATREHDWDAHAEVDTEADFDAIAPPPLIFQRSSVSHRSSGRRTAGAGGLVAERKRPAARTSFRHARTKSMPSMGAALPVWQRQSRPSLEVEQQHHTATLDDGHMSTADTTDGEDENDFHRAMLDGDFDDEYGWTSAGAIDTPATTPRSPQSTCEPLSALTEDGKDEASNSNTDKMVADAQAAKAASERAAQELHDAVFARALPSSSRRVRSHAGALTLSLPFDESPSIKKEQHDDDELDRQHSAIARFSTPTLRRTASKGKLSQLQLSASRPSAVKPHPTSQADNETTSPTTSPPMSPTRALMGLAAPPHSKASLGVSMSMTSSPFLAAVHRSSLSRPGSPLPTFNLPAAVTTSSTLGPHHSPATAAGATAASPASTHQDLTDVSPFPSASPHGAEDGRDLDEDELDLDGSRSASVDQEDGSSPITTYSSPGAEHDDDEANAPAVFGLPESMDMSAIDVAYGGTGMVVCEAEPEQEEEQKKDAKETQEVEAEHEVENEAEDEGVEVVVQAIAEKTPDRPTRRGLRKGKRCLEAAQEEEDEETSSRKAARSPSPIATPAAASPPPPLKRKYSSKAAAQRSTPRQQQQQRSREGKTAAASPVSSSTSPSRTMSTRATTVAAGGRGRRSRGA